MVIIFLSYYGSGSGSYEAQVVDLITRFELWYQSTYQIAIYVFYWKLQQLLQTDLLCIVFNVKHFITFCDHSRRLCRTISVVRKNMQYYCKRFIERHQWAYMFLASAPSRIFCLCHIILKNCNYYLFLCLSFVVTCCQYVVVMSVSKT